MVRFPVLGWWHRKEGSLVCLERDRIPGNERFNCSVATRFRAGVVKAQQQ
jgi:hypothetical protein